MIILCVFGLLFNMVFYFGWIIIVKDDKFTKHNSWLQLVDFTVVICDDEKLRFCSLFLANPTFRSVFYLHLVQLMSQSHRVSITWSPPQVNLKTGHAPLPRWVHQNAQSKEEETHLVPVLKPGETHECCPWKKQFDEHCGCLRGRRSCDRTAGDFTEDLWHKSSAACVKMLRLLLLPLGGVGNI